jgi:hypothetical protein
LFPGFLVVLSGIYYHFHVKWLLVVPLQLEALFVSIHHSGDIEHERLAASIESFLAIAAIELEFHCSFVVLQSGDRDPFFADIHGNMSLCTGLTGVKGPFVSVSSKKQL